jgi:hypothetical protein
MTFEFSKIKARRKEYFSILNIYLDILFGKLQALDVSPTCDAADVKSTIQIFPHSSQHVTGNSSHSLSDAPLQIFDIRTLRHFLSIRTQDMDLASVVFVK